jgi:hypothetical protein
MIANPEAVESGFVIISVRKSPGSAKCPPMVSSRAHHLAAEINDASEGPHYSMYLFTCSIALRWGNALIAWGPSLAAFIIMADLSARDDTR